MKQNITEMKVIQSGNSYTPITKDAIIHDTFPPAIYKILFNQMTGYDIRQEPDFEPIEDKIYGNSTYRIDKMFNAFNHYRSNMGVMLSGPKGIGKSLFIRLAVLDAIKKGLPVFIIDGYTPDLPGFLSKIKQQCLIIIDEFEKKFERDQQVELLSFLDGMNTDKKLFIVSLNEVHRMNEYMINRPGRFHYHYRFTNPTGEEVTEYLNDNLKNNKDIIPVLTKFAQKTNLNYDSLHAIVFELNIGSTLDEAIQDLNIAKSGDESYNITIHTKEYGDITFSDSINLFDEYIRAYDYHSNGHRFEFISTAMNVETLSDTQFSMTGVYKTWDEDEDGESFDIEVEATATITKIIPKHTYDLKMLT